MFGLSLTTLGIASAVAAVALAYNFLIENPSIEREVAATTRTIVEAEARQKTEDAINEVSDAAERARAMRRWCADNGLQYDFATGECRQ